jgi:hypothetical protein
MKRFLLGFVLLGFVLSVRSQVTIYSENFGITAGVFPTGWTTTGTPGTTGWDIFTTGGSSGYTGASGSGQLRTGSTSGSMTVTYDNSLSTVGYTNIQVIWGGRRTSAQVSPTFEWSNDGATWNTVSFTDVTNNSTWALVNGGTAITLPVGAEGVTNLRFRWTATVSGTSGYRIDDFLVTGAFVTTNYYSKPTGNLTAVATWGTNTDGTGTSPSNFTDNGQIFNVVNRSSVTLDANWTVSGTASKIIVGDGSSLVRLILPAGITITNVAANPVDVTNSAILEVQNNVYIPATSNIPYPYLGTLDAASTVEYSHAGTSSADTVRIPTGTFGYLTLTNGLKYFSSGTTSVVGDINANGVVGMNGWYQLTYSTINLTGNFIMSGGAVFDNDPAGLTGRITLNMIGTSTQTLSGGDFQLFSLRTLGSPASTLNIVLSNANVLVGNTSGGGVNLQQAAHTLSLGAGNTLTLRNSGIFYSTHAGFLSGTTTSNLVINKTTGTQNIGTLRFTTGSELLNNLTYNSASPGNDTLTLATDLTLSGSLTMTAGKIDIGANDLSVTGTATSSNYSYVMTSGAGFLKLLGVNSSRFAPIGNSTYNAVTVNNTDGLDWNLRVEDALNVDDPLFSGNTVKAVQREWFVNPVTYPTTTNSTIVFEYNDGDATQIGGSYNINANVQVWRKQPGPPNPFNWVAYSGTQFPGGTPGSDRTAQVTGFNSFTGYSFAISNLDGPLPVKLIDFKVQKINNGLANLTWELAACCSNAAKFEIQKSGDSRSFVSFATVNGSETNRFYTYNDARLGAGITYYLLKMTDVDGSVSYSKVVAVVNQADGFVITSLSPNPATSVAKLSISSARMLPVSFVIYNTNGAIIKRWSSVIAEGNAVVDVEVARLPAGVYTIMAVSGTSKASIRLVKQ